MRLKASMMPMRFLLVLMMLMAPSFTKAQTSFDPEEGCLNVVDITPSIGIMASISDETYLVKAFDTQRNDYRNKLIHDLGISIGVCFQINGW